MIIPFSFQYLLSPGNTAMIGSGSIDHEIKAGALCYQ